MFEEVHAEIRAIKQVLWETDDEWRYVLLQYQQLLFGVKKDLNLVKPLPEAKLRVPLKSSSGLIPQIMQSTRFFNSIFISKPSFNVFQRQNHGILSVSSYLLYGAFVVTKFPT
jgi:hypothetical protein